MFYLYATTASVCALVLVVLLKTITPVDIPCLCSGLFCSVVPTLLPSLLIGFLAESFRNRPMMTVACSGWCFYSGWWWWWLSCANSSRNKFRSCSGAAVMKRVSSHQALMNELSTQSIRRETPQKQSQDWFFPAPTILDLRITKFIPKSRFGCDKWWATQRCLIIVQWKLHKISNSYYVFFLQQWQQSRKNGISVANWLSYLMDIK